MTATISGYLPTVNELDGMNRHIASLEAENACLRHAANSRVSVWEVVGMLRQYSEENERLRAQVKQLTVDIGKLHTTLDAVESTLKELQRERFLIPLDDPED